MASLLAGPVVTLVERPPGAALLEGRPADLDLARPQRQ
jgi:hypothetical protein